MRRDGLVGGVGDKACYNIGSFIDGVGGHAMLAVWQGFALAIAIKIRATPPKSDAQMVVSQFPSSLICKAAERPLIQIGASFAVDYLERDVFAGEIPTPIGSDHFEYVSLSVSGRLAENW
ncbi:MAG: hypothetical protein R2795_16875 [Saprospiraceae bacterium]